MTREGDFLAWQWLVTVTDHLPRCQDPIRVADGVPGAKVRLGIPEIMGGRQLFTTGELCRIRVHQYVWAT